MPLISTVALIGQTGKQYVFDVWEMDLNRIPRDGGVYAVTRRYDDEGTPSHRVLYIGQALNLSTEFENHPKADCFVLHDANCICTFAVNDEEIRSAVEMDLVGYYHPRCNA